MLGLADAVAVIVASVTLALLVPGGMRAGLYAAAFLPLWIVLAKLHGLYDRDHSALRHLRASRARRSIRSRRTHSTGCEAWADRADGRGQLTLDERIAVEREYIENLSLGRDFRTLAMTFAAVFASAGAY
jgi:hypothetical protein